jgi:biotin-(acetyl-CoA carboxylase) ligase
MVNESQSRPRPGSKPALDLPPPFQLITLREVGDAFAHAVKVAAEEGAGTLVYVGRFDLAEFAVVLEPEEPLRTARRALYAGLTALADALLVHAPPEKPITFDWPDAVRVDGGLVGGARLAWPADAREDEPPQWLVFGAMIRTVAMGEHEPGLTPLASALEDEGFDGLGSARLVESFARHLMVAIDSWQEKGFAEIAKNYLSRLAPVPVPPPPGVKAASSGLRRDLDDNGDLLVRRMGKVEVERRALLPMLAVPSWFDPKTGGPRT